MRRGHKQSGLKSTLVNIYIYRYSYYTIIEGGVVFSYFECLPNSFFLGLGGVGWDIMKHEHVHVTQTTIS